MKKKGRSETAGGGIAGEYCSPDTWRLASWNGGGGRLVGLGGGRESRNDERKRKQKWERERALDADAA